MPGQSIELEMQLEQLVSGQLVSANNAASASWCPQQNSHDKDELAEVWGPLDPIPPTFDPLTARSSGITIRAERAAKLSTGLCNNLKRLKERHCTLQEALQDEEGKRYLFDKLPVGGGSFVEIVDALMMMQRSSFDAAEFQYSLIACS